MPVYLLSTRTPPPGVAALAAAGRVRVVAQYALDGLDPAGVPGLFVGMHADQVHLERRRPVLEAVLDGGGAVVWSGHVAREAVGGLSRFVPLPDPPRLADFRVRPLVPHPVFEGFDQEQLTFRRGVAGFYGRGHNPMPAGAVALNGLGPAGAPVDWEWRRPGGGRMLMHAGNDLWSLFDEAELNARMLGRLMDWILEGGIGGPGRGA
jgi:hypothetical protein